MSTTTSPPPLAAAPESRRIKKAGEMQSGESIKPAGDSARTSLRLWDAVGQESPSEEPKELRFRFADLRYECERLAEVAKKAAADSDRFARVSVEAAAIALSLKRGGATQALLASLLFGGEDNAAGAELIDQVLRDLTSRGLLKPRVRQIGKPFFWIARDAIGCIREKMRLKQQLAHFGAESQEGAADE